MSNFELMVRLDEIELITSLLIGCINKHNVNTSSELQDISDGLEVASYTVCSREQCSPVRGLSLTKT